ncbi:Aldo keto reductase [Mycena capillaripes]|nr:Aldo keto reductase [Mycena capillaripes]
MSSESTAPAAPSRRVKYVRLGNSGLKVSEIILGCMSYGSSEWRPWTLDEEESIKHIKYAYDAGIQTFDTANMYSNGMGEIVLGNAIKKLQLPREEIVVMTKVRHPVGKTLDVNALELFLAGPDTRGYVNQYGLSRKHIMTSVQDSLKRLQLDYIDLLQCHRFDYETPIAETMQALHDVVKAGYVRYIGMSSCHAWQFHIMQNYAITHNLTPFISMQNHYNLLHREEEREMMPTLKHFGVGSIPWSPLRAVRLRARPLPPRRQRRKLSAKEAMSCRPTWSKDIVDRVEEVARKYGATMAQVSLAWLMAKEGVTAPIVGTTSLDKLADLLGALDVKLTLEDIAYLEEPYKPMGIFMYN